MKKILLISVLAGLSASASAVDFSGGSATASSTISVTFATCTNIKEDVTVNLSSGNFGVVTCNIADNIIGVAVASSKGAKKVFTASSKGGSIGEQELAALPTAASALTSYANTAASSQ